MSWINHIPWNKIEPVYSNLFEISFLYESNELNHLSNNFTGVEDETFNFECIIINQKIQPLSILNKIKKNKKEFDILFTYKDKNDNEIGFLLLETCKVININDNFKIDVSLESNKIFKCFAEIKPENRIYFDTIKDYKKYDRKRKLERIKSI